MPDRAERPLRLVAALTLGYGIAASSATEPVVTT
jgi:hypothetical protein